MTVIEVTGGSTGTSLAMVCAQKGLKFKAFTSDAFAEEKLKNIKAFGGLLDLTISDKGKVSRDLFPIMMQKCKMMCKEDNQIYYADQFNNRDALPGYENIGLELITQFPDGIDKFCGTVGTAVKGKKGLAHIQLMAFRYLNETLYDEVMTVDEEKGRNHAKELAKKEGIFAGTSSGMNVAAAIQIAAKLPTNSTVVTIACDTGLKYLSTSLYD